MTIQIKIGFHKIHFARQQGGNYPVVHLRPVTPRNYFSECLYCNRSDDSAIGDLYLQAIMMVVVNPAPAVIF
jgi:hypothetical protein